MAQYSNQFHYTLFFCCSQYFFDIYRNKYNMGNESAGSRSVRKKIRCGYTADYIGLDYVDY